MPQTSNLVLVSGSYSAAVARQQAMQSAAGGMVGVRRRMKLLSGKWTWNPALGGSPGLLRSRRGGNVGLTHPEVCCPHNGCVGPKLTEEGGGRKRQANTCTQTYQQVRLRVDNLLRVCVQVSSAASDDLSWLRRVRANFSSTSSKLSERCSEAVTNMIFEHCILNLNFDVDNEGTVQSVECGCGFVRSSSYMDVCICYMSADTDMDMSVKYWHTRMILCEKKYTCACRYVQVFVLKPLWQRQTERQKDKKTDRERATERTRERQRNTESHRESLTHVPIR